MTWAQPTEVASTVLPVQPMLWLWRHPRPLDAQGRCIGQTDVLVPIRRAKRLARRIQQHARRHRLPHVVYTSPLQRCRAVGLWLKRWGWRHIVDSALLESNFGDWEGRPWHDIARHEIDEWCDNFAHHRPGGGESLASFLERASLWAPTKQAPSGHTIVVAHAGWMLGRQWMLTHGKPPALASDWPPAPAYGQLWPLRMISSHTELNTAP